MPLSNKFVVQYLGELLKKYEIFNVVSSPGSRNAPIMAHLATFNKFNLLSIADERSAAFFALGMAQQIKKPVIITCTSGSAVANYYPAITEAFYQNIPILVVSADRPLSYVDKFDGQTIRQHKLLEKHCYYSVSIEEFEEEKSIKKKLEKAIFIAFKKSGPVHINLPFDEPLYDYVEEIGFNEIEKINYPKTKIISEKKIASLAKIWNNCSRKLVLVGLLHPSKKIEALLLLLSQDPSVVILTETTSNLNHDRFLSNTDALIFSMNEKELEELKPDLLLTIGQNIVSKRVKSFLRNHAPKFHWHLDENWQPDTYNCLTHKIKTSKQDFLEKFIPLIKNIESNYLENWEIIKEKRSNQHNYFLENTSFSDLKAFDLIFKNIPENYQLQLGNSTVVRYAQLFKNNNQPEVFCNRGTSGIDGSTSTAIGAAYVANKKMLLVSGDLSFLYDSNALWNNYIKNTVRIIVINNGGGNIFKVIPGPEKSTVLEKCFEHKHELKMNYLAQMFGFDYLIATNEAELIQCFSSFYEQANCPKILEIDTSKFENAQLLRNYFRSMV